MSDQLQLNVFTMNCVGHLNAGLWRHPADQAHRYKDQSYWVELALIAERGKLDAIFIADVLGIYDVYEGGPEPAIREAMQTPVNDPLHVIPTMAYMTNHLGFASTYSTTYTHPFMLAQKFSTLDHLTDGRIAWNIVTSYLSHAAKNFGLEGRVPHDERYDRADEYMEVLYKLWEESWEDDAVVRDVARGVYTDPDKVHTIDHEGAYFNVPGPHVCEPSPQRTPVLYQAGQSDRGRAFAAKHAEAVFTMYPTEEMVGEYIDDMRRRAEEAGRDPQHLKIFPGIVPIVGETEDVARAKYEAYKEFASYDAAFTHTGGATDVDFSKYAPTQTVEDIQTEGHQGMLGIFTESTPGESPSGRQQWTMEEVAQSAALGSFFPVVVGTPGTIADWLERWSEDLGADGFNLVELEHSGTVRDFVEMVVPELQRRGIFRKEYKYDTLRGRLLQQEDPRLRQDHPGRSSARR